MQRLKKGDEVIVNAGKDKGRHGIVLRVKGDRVVVEGVNIAKKHTRPDPNKGVQGGIVEKELSIHASNVNIYNPDTDKGDRIGFRFLDENGVRRKVRYFKSNDEVIDT